ncbi:S-layer homology domain-containing protein [Leptothoe kymatousa]|uniref:S-layer homology domain-containing protein n=1 Tax=Leptothoe kymatousa TAU-MAC 1615 TaxID=2364775 RepID=A0ABS5XZD6_9CYAN|nr:S-layer homology domain-containing protein [Leptothoe kymatousa]MBT9310604.1 S-layer homology domain-containing protein [Leptothoe kymatousa TAU-MAC 1615]
MVQAPASVLYVNNVTGRVQGSGTRRSPLRTLTQALGKATSGTTVQLESGTYGNGEAFPLTVPIGVTVMGLGDAVTIRGGGTLATEDVGPQSVTLQLRDRAQLRGITVTNPQSQGVGVWLEDGSALLTRCRFLGCGRDGVFVTGDAMPVLLDNEFSQNQASGLFMARQTKGEVRQNRFIKTSYGIAISDQSAPLLVDNDVLENRAGIVLSRSARPVLRQNRVRQNQSSGLWVQDTALPDIGQSQDLGGNSFQDNRQWDIRNDGRQLIISAGNFINPNRVQGNIRYVASELPDPVAVPSLLLGKVKPVGPLPEPPRPTPPESNLDSRFRDVMGHWGAPFINAMAKAELVKGFFDGSFRPDALVTRAQFAALVMATFPSTGDNQRRFKAFRDVASNFWARKVIYQAQAQGFIAGFPDGTFRPNDPMTRVQALVALMSGLRFGQGQASELGVYDDRAQVPTYAVEEVAIATRRSIVVNHPDVSKLRPMQPITRAETTALVHQCLVNLGRMQPPNSPFIVRPQVASSAANVAVAHWADDFWQALVAQSFLKSTWAPTDAMTRAEFASLVFAAFAPKPQRYPVAFRDVPEAHWAANAIQITYRAKFLSGFPDYTFAPDQPILKIQVLLALVSGLNLRTKGTAGLLSRYEDHDQVPRYAAVAIATATKLGLVFNHPNLDMLTPNHVVTCGEVAAMVYQGLVLRKRMPPVGSPYQVVIAK